ncbi:hypothetical protein FRZ61_21180 [Hypericibacter adhaerens]|jgi:uncharacterized protein (DUF1330 family)|uniref:DUF1330 domain-containing protein n=1 Tax=Hypericibacter adhaerens TaxID=2602016 RepID=A0A5J6MX00_9PROT|nr:DUF1330 domain-containing protein [Hypericibacter adhaerens]QEX22188.1 hypothetical protein FRZ61_21180 [Hypericibacter adhaerens]
MKAYCLFQEEIIDQAGFDAYRQQVMPTLAPFGGRFIVRGGHFTKVEGDMPYSRVVIVEFASREQAEGWYHSPAYQKLVPQRLKATRGNLIIVDGAE